MITDIKMPGTILENLSDRKLCVLIIILLVSQLSCLLVGLIVPNPPTSQPILSTTVCVDENLGADHNRWFTWYCPKSADLAQEKAAAGLEANNLVYVVQMPVYDVAFSRWQQNLAGILQVNMVYQAGQKIDPVVELTIDARLAYSDNNGSSISVFPSLGGKTPWQYFVHAEEKRYMDCTFKDKNVREKQGYSYSCTMAPLFELGSVYHDYYLLNLRLPYNNATKTNTGLGEVEYIYLQMVYMNGDFTREWVTLKTFLFIVVMGITLWFWRRVHMLNRVPALLEYMLISLGGSLAFLNLPTEYLSVTFDMPYMLLLNDIRQGVFYTMLLSFWLVFVGELMLIQDSSEKVNLKVYWKQLSTIVISCLCLLIFDICKRGVQLINPFYSIWVMPVGTNLVLSFIVVAGVSVSMYFVVLCYMIRRVFKNIRIKRAILPSMSQTRRLHYEGILWRYKFLMLSTVICAAVTIIFFILSLVAKSVNKWEMQILPLPLYTGIYGMWNLYIGTVLVFYTPSHSKQYTTNTVCARSKEALLEGAPISSRDCIDSPRSPRFSLSRISTFWNVLGKFFRDATVKQPNQNEIHSLSQDIARLMCRDDTKDTLIECKCGAEEAPIKAHSWIIKCRSAELGDRLLTYTDEKNENLKYLLQLSDLSRGLVSELILYIYTDEVDNVKKYCRELLPLSTAFQLPGLTVLCERYLSDNLTPNIHLVDDQSGCKS